MEPSSALNTSAEFLIIKPYRNTRVWFIILLIISVATLIGIFAVIITNRIKQKNQSAIHTVPGTVLRTQKNVSGDYNIDIYDTKTGIIHLFNAPAVLNNQEQNNLITRLTQIYVSLNLFQGQIINNADAQKHMKFLVKF